MCKGSSNLTVRGSPLFVIVVSRTTHTRICLVAGDDVSLFASEEELTAVMKPVFLGAGDEGSIPFVCRSGLLVVLLFTALADGTGVVLLFSFFFSVILSVLGDGVADESVSSIDGRDW